MRVVLIFMSFLALGYGSLEAVEYTTAHPLSTVITTPVKECGKFPQLPVPMLAWVGDMPIIYANGSAETTSPGSIFAKKNLSVKLYRQDSLVSQVEDYLSCKTPFLRLTNGMAVMAMDVLNADAHTKPRPFYLYTWSEGGDVLVGRGSIKEPKDICNTDGSLQVYSPHVEYLATIARLAGCRIPVEKIHWVKDMIEETKTSMYPARALREDATIQWVFAISPDANDLTYSKKTPGIGDGGEGSVQGAHVILSTKSCTTCIPDLLYVRNDWYESSKENQEIVSKLVHGLLLAQQETVKLMAEKQPKKVYDQWISVSAKMLLGSSDLIPQTEAMWNDARFARWEGNVKFFTDNANPRNLATLVREASEAFGPTGLKLIAKSVSLTPVVLDYPRLSEGLDMSGVEAPRFNREAIEQVVRERAQVGSLDQDRLFYFNVWFKPNQTVFPPDLYYEKFDQMIEFMSTFGGAIYTIEAYADTQKYLLLKCGTVTNASGEKKLDVACKSGTGSPELLARMKQAGKNDTLLRAKALKDSVIVYAKAKGVTLNAEQIEIVGHGFMKPHIPGCKYDKDGDITVSCYPSSQEEWNAMRYAQFSVISTESDVYQAAK